MTDLTPANTPEFTVSELSGALKRTIEDAFGQVRVRGELGRVTIARSGHVYVDLKDANAVLSSVMWKGVASQLSFRPEEGLEVIAVGRLTTFPGQSRYQLVIDRLEPAGVGALLAQLEERRKRLAAEGLFDADRKRPIPFLPRVIGVITSPTGAVIRDILHRLEERFPRHVLLWPVLVQGNQAAEQVARAIAGFDAIPAHGPVPRPDVLIVARGGGAIEDLMPFNEEVVVRAVAACSIPLISAVGHETDTTLIDYVSDLRAPTPTGAAEKAVPVRAELLERAAMLEARLIRGVARGVDSARTELRAASARLPKAETLLANARQRFDLAEGRLAPGLRALVQRGRGRFEGVAGRLRPEVLGYDLKRRTDKLSSLEQRLKAASERRMAKEKDGITQGATRLASLGDRLIRVQSRNQRERARNLEALALRLSSVSHESVLARGFALVQDQSGKLVRSVQTAKQATTLTISVADGSFEATLAGSSNPRPRARPSAPSDGETGTLL
jgi:exodeoxyribonuclease VII large subunit